MAAGRRRESRVCVDSRCYVSWAQFVHSAQFGFGAEPKLCDRAALVLREQNCIDAHANAAADCPRASCSLQAASQWPMGCTHAHLNWPNDPERARGHRLARASCPNGQCAAVWGRGWSAGDRGSRRGRGAPLLAVGLGSQHGRKFDISISIGPRLRAGGGRTLWMDSRAREGLPAGGRALVAAKPPVGIPLGSSSRVGASCFRRPIVKLSRSFGGRRVAVVELLARSGRRRADLMGRRARSTERSARGARPKASGEKREAEASLAGPIGRVCARPPLPRAEWAAPTQWAGPQTRFARRLGSPAGLPVRAPFFNGHALRSAQTRRPDARTQLQSIHAGGPRPEIVGRLASAPLPARPTRHSALAGQCIRFRAADRSPPSADSVWPTALNGPPER